jgi:hypothetical protein
VLPCVPEGGTGGLPITGRLETVHSYFAAMARAVVQSSEEQRAASARVVELAFYARMQTRVVGAALAQVLAPVADRGREVRGVAARREGSGQTAVQALHQIAADSGNLLNQRISAGPTPRLHEERAGVVLSTTVEDEGEGDGA